MNRLHFITTAVAFFSIVCCLGAGMAIGQVPQISYPKGVTASNVSGVSTTTVKIAVMGLSLPTISFFSPTNASTGDTIKIKGTSFTGTTKVSFGDSVASYFSVLNDSIITAVVGNGSSGNVRIVTPNGIGIIAGFKYDSSLYILGTALVSGWSNPISIINLSSQKFTRISQNEYKINVNLIGGKEYKFIAQNGSWNENWGISIADDPNEINGGVLTSNGSNILSPSKSGNYIIDINFLTNIFSVTLITPSISSFTPTSVCLGTTTNIKILGKNFKSTTSLKFGGTVASSFIVNNDTSITASVPKNATTGAITLTTPDGTATSNQIFDILNPSIIANNISITPGSSALIKINSNTYSGIRYDTIDFSSKFNFNLSTYNTSNFANFASGSQTFDSIPFYFYPWAKTLNGWNATFDSSNNPIVLKLLTSGKRISALDLVANTYWGNPTTSLLKVQFWSLGKIVFQKELIGNIDIRDYEETVWTNVINNTSTVNIWSSNIIRLDKIKIQLPQKFNVDSILVVDNGGQALQRVFVMAATVEVDNILNPNILWSNGNTTDSIRVFPTQTTTYSVKVSDGTTTCRDSLQIKVAWLAPIILSDIEVRSENDNIILNWHSNSELNTSHFIIQNSTDGKLFTDLSTVNAIGSGGNNYQYMDLASANGVNYYRLQFIYKDGSFSYSKIVSAAITKNKFAITVYPNPVKETLSASIHSGVEENVLVAVSDMQGKVLIQNKQKLGEGNNLISVDTHQLAKGSYLLVIKGKGVTQNQFIKE